MTLRLILILLTVTFVISQSSEHEISTGFYRIRSFTRNRGWRSLEAFPGSDLVRPRPSSYHQDQKWEVRNEGGYYRISCDTQSGGKRYLEAFPGKEMARPRTSEPDNHDQKWNLEYLDGNRFRIVCYTKNEGRKALEAFPKSDVVKVVEASNDQDQIWEFIPW